MGWGGVSRGPGGRGRGGLCEDAVLEVPECQLHGGLHVMLVECL